MSDTIHHLKALGKHISKIEKLSIYHDRYMRNRYFIDNLNSGMSRLGISLESPRRINLIYNYSFSSMIDLRGVDDFSMSLLSLDFLVSQYFTRKAYHRNDHKLKNRGR